MKPRACRRTRNTSHGECWVRLGNSAGVITLRVRCHFRRQVVAADTKVVERGKADGMFITTSGIGVIAEGLQLATERAQQGDAILVSGPIGDHGIAVMSAREGLEFETTVVSDCAPLHELVSTMLTAGRGIRCMRDATRGGVATVLNELAKSSGMEMTIDESAVPVRDAVRAACEILGLDPLYVACEGRLVAIVDDAHAEQVLAAMRAQPLGTAACRIGTVIGGAGRACCCEPPSVRLGFWICFPANNCRGSAETCEIWTPN